MDLPLSYREDMSDDELTEAFIADGLSREDAVAMTSVVRGDVPEGLPVL